MRILAWNIQWFTLSRVEPSPQGSLAADFDDADRVVANRVYISSTVRAADPDVFVVLEARCSWNQTVGTLASGDGTTALQILLASLRLVNANWCLVPPLRTNPSELEAAYTETIGVYYRSDRVTFTGPLQWPLNTAGNAPSPTGPPIPPGGNVAASYPAPWNATVPQGTVAAAQTSFTTNNGSVIYFTQNINRRPYLTTFTELGGMQRNVRLFSVHLPPRRVSSQQALSSMASISDADSRPGNNELTVIVGDMNVNLNGDTMARSADDTLRMRGYRQVYPQSRGSGWGRVYEPSIIKSRTDATFDDYKTGRPCYDYGYVWYGQGAQPAAWPGRGVVADRVAGVAAANTLPGFTHDMRITLAELGNLPIERLRQIYGPNAQRSNLFRERWNYGHISRPDGTSDHLPFFLIV